MTDYVSDRDHKIVNNTYLRYVLYKGPTYQSINWTDNFKMLMDSVGWVGGGWDAMK